MRHFVYKLLLFILIIYIIVFGLNFILAKCNNAPLYFSLQYDEVINKKVKANCIIIGTSHGTHAIRPSYLNTDKYKFYNFSLSGAGPGFYIKWYKNIFKPNYPNPEYCIFAVDWFMFDGNWLWRRYEQDALYFPSVTFYKSIFHVKSYDTRTLLQNRYPFFIHKSVSDLEFAFRGEKGDKDFFTSDYDNGYVPWFAANKVGVIDPPQNIIVDTALVNDFIYLIKSFQSSNTKILFVNTPEYGLPMEEYYFKPTLWVIDSIAKQYKIPFLNYNIEKRSNINNEAGDFIDWGHMSSEGSKKFSKVLSRDIKEIMQ